MKKRWITTWAEYEWRDGWLRQVAELGHWYAGPMALATTPPTMEVTDWAFYSDGTEAGSTIIGAKNSNQTLDVDTTYFVRFGLEETSGNSSKNTAPQLQYNKGGAGWNNVTATSSVVRATATANITDGADTTQRLTAFTYASSNEGFDEVDGVAGGGTADLISNGFEALFSFQIRGADVVDSDTIVLKIVDSNDADADYDVYNQTDPTVTVNEAAGAQTINADYLASASAVSQPTIDSLATIGSDHVPSAAQVYQPTATAEQTIQAGHVVSAAAIYQPTLDIAQTLQADHVPSATQVYPPTLDAVATISAAHVPSAAAVNQPTVTAEQTISADHVPSAATIYQPTVDAGLTINADHVASASAVNQPTITTQTTIDTDHVPSGAQIPQPSVSASGGTQAINADYLPSAAQVQPPSVTAEQTIQADHVSAASQVPQPGVASVTTINADHVPGSSQVHQPATATLYVIHADYLGSVSQVYQPTIDGGDGPQVIAAPRAMRRDYSSRPAQADSRRPAQTYRQRPAA